LKQSGISYQRLLDLARIDPVSQYPEFRSDCTGHH